MKITVGILFFSLLVTGIILLQIYLSKREEKWLSLILPSISFTYSMVALAGLIGFSTVRNDSGKDSLNLIILAITTVLYSNVPTVILLLISRHYSEKKKRGKELEQMNIRDLS